MKKAILALAISVLVPSLCFAQSISIGSASGPAGGAAAPVPVAITFAPNAAPNAANSVRDIDARLTYDATRITPVFGAGTILGGTCTITMPGVVVVSYADNGALVPAGTICNITAIAITPGAVSGPTTLAIAKGVGSGCGNAAAVSANCTYNNGTVTITPPGAAANVAQTPAALAFAASNVGIAAPQLNLVLTNTTANAGSVTCTIGGVNAADFSFFPVVPGGTIALAANAVVNVPVRFTPSAAGARGGSIACVGVGSTTVVGSPTALTGTGNAPIVAATITPAPLGGTAATPVTLTIANAGAQPIGTVINIGGLTVTGAGFIAPAVGSWGACVYSADATPPALTTSDPAAFTTGPQLVFNAANNGTAQPLIIGATRRAGQVSAILTCPVAPAGILPAANANVYRLVLAAGAAPPAVLNVTPPVSSAAMPLVVGTPTLAGTQVGPRLIPVSAPAANTGNVSIVSCTAINSVPAGLFNYGNPAPVFPIVIAPGATVNIPVFYNPPVGAPVGVYPGDFTCTTGVGNAPATFQVFVSGSVIAAPVVSLVTQVPTLSTLSIWLLVASMLGFGLVMVRRQS